MLRINPSFVLGGDGRLNGPARYYYPDQPVETFHQRLAREGQTDTALLRLPAYRADTDIDALRVVRPPVADASTIDHDRFFKVSGLAAPYNQLSYPCIDCVADDAPHEYVRWLLAPGCFSAWLAGNRPACFVIGHDERIVLDNTDTTLRFMDTEEGLRFSASVDDSVLLRAEDSEPLAAHLRRRHGVAVSIMALFEEYTIDRQPRCDPVKIIQRASVDHVALVTKSAFPTYCARR